MKKILITLVLLAAMPIWSYSQVAYPKLIKLNEDSVCVLTIGQLKKINIEFAELDFYHELSDTLKSLNRKKDFIIGKQNELISNNDSQLRIKQDIIDTQTVQVSNLKMIDKYSQRQINGLKLQRNGLAVLIGVAVLKIFVFK
jgi:hypothetical protein